MNKQYPKVSIVIPTYNQPEFIYRAVNSALMQDYANLEVIVSDDSLTDAAEVALKEILKDPRLTYYHNNPRLGRVANYRTCLYKYASGEWILNLDGDDYLIEKSFISLAIELVHTERDIVFVQAGGLVINANNVLLQTKMPLRNEMSCVKSGWAYLNDFAHKRNFLHLTTLYKADVAKSIDFYRFEGLSSDLESFMRLALHGKVGLLNMKAGVWFHHNQNTSDNASEAEIIQNTSWIDNVMNYALNNSLLNRFQICYWTYFVKNNELNYEFIRRLRQQKTINEVSGYLIRILKKYPQTFFYPTFQKKLIQIFLKKVFKKLKD